MTQFLLVIAVLFSPIRAAESGQQNGFTLEPDFSTLQLYGDGPRTVEPCGAWPVKPFQPRAFNMRGKIFNESSDEVGRYFVRGWVRQSDGAHVADYALTIKTIGTIVFSIDALPDAANAAEFDTFVFSGEQRNQPIQLILRPRVTTDCTWGMRWEFLLSTTGGLKQL